MILPMTQEKALILLHLYGKNHPLHIQVGAPLHKKGMITAQHELTVKGQEAVVKAIKERLKFVRWSE